MKAPVTFYLKDPNAERETLIYAFPHFDGTRLKLSTGLKVKQGERHGCNHDQQPFRCHCRTSENDLSGTEEQEYRFDP